MNDKIVKVIFEEGWETQFNESLVQWSYGHVLQIEGLTLPDGNIEVHFSLTENNGNASVLIGTVENNIITVKFPDYLLAKENTYQPSYDAWAWIYLTDEDSGQTIRKIVFTIETRAKPDDYVYTEGEIKLWSKLEKEINEVQAKEDFVAEYGVTTFEELEEAYQNDRSISALKNDSENTIVKLEAGTYDADGNLLQTWEELNHDIEKDFSPPNSLGPKLHEDTVTLIIADGVKKIGDSQLYGISIFLKARGLKYIYIPESVTDIGNTTSSLPGAFASILTLESIAIPNSVTFIDSNTFSGCTNLKTIYYSGTATGFPWGASNATILPYEDAPQELLGLSSKVTPKQLHADLHVKKNDLFIFNTIEDNMLYQMICDKDSNWTCVEFNVALKEDIPKKVSELENDVGYVENTDIATSNKAGLARFTPTYGLAVNEGNGSVSVQKATTAQIDTKEELFRPLVPAMLDYGVMKALTDSKKHAWTDEEKTKALELLGALQKNTDKTTYHQLYGKSADGTSQWGVDYTTGAIQMTIAQRGVGGTLNVGTPTEGAHATTKAYVDDLAPFIATYGTTTYEEILEAYKANKTLLVRVLKDESNSELTGGAASEIVACLSRVDGLGVQMKNGDHGFVSSEDNLATFSLRNLESFDKTLLSMRVKFEHGGYQTRIDIGGTGAWTGISVYEENGNLVIKDLYGMTPNNFYQALTPDIAEVESFLDNEFLLQLKFDYNTSNAIGSLGVYINGQLYNDETFCFTGMKPFGNCMSLYREVADSVITVNSVTAEDENVLSFDGYKLVTVSDFIEGTEKETPVFTFTADENGVVRYYKIMNADKEWIFWNYKYANNIDNHDKQILGLNANVNKLLPNVNELLPLLTKAYDSFRGGFRNTAGTLDIKCPGIYLVIGGGTGNKTMTITQNSSTVYEETCNGWIVISSDTGIITPVGIKTSLTLAGAFETPGTYQGWTKDGTHSTKISYPAESVIWYLGNSNNDVGTW